MPPDALHSASATPPPPTLFQRAVAAGERGAVLVAVNGLLVMLCGSTTWWDVAFVALLSLLVIPLALAAWWGAGRSLRAHALMSLAAAGLAGVGFVAAWVQVTYTYELVQLGSFDGAIRGLGAAVDRMLASPAETRAALLAFAPSFGLVLFFQLRGRRALIQVVYALIGANVCFAIALQGFIGWPQITWLVGASWCSPGVGTFLLLQPILLPITLTGVHAILGPPRQPEPEPPEESEPEPEAGAEDVIPSPRG